MSFEKGEQYSIHISNLQEYNFQEFRKKGINVINGESLYHNTFGHVIEFDQLLPQYWIVIEYWNSKDRRYRARKVGLKSGQFRLDALKTKGYLCEHGLFPLWVDQAKHSGRKQFELLLRFLAEIETCGNAEDIYRVVFTKLTGELAHFIIDCTRFDYGLELEVSPENFNPISHSKPFKLPNKYKTREDSIDA